MAAYGSKLWVVVNCSNKVEVLDLKNRPTAPGEIDIPNCRYIAFDGRYAYVTSYAGRWKSVRLQTKEVRGGLIPLLHAGDREGRVGFQRTVSPFATA